MSRKAAEPDESGAVVVACAWMTGDRRCLIRPSGGMRCQWHKEWMRLVDAGSIGEGQAAAFRVWWEQFQPTGIYADNHGPWWADVEVLWQSLIGQAEAPKLTSVLARELYIRRAEVRRYLSGLPMGETLWARVHGLPLPVWIEEEWKAKVDSEIKARVLPAC